VSSVSKESEFYQFMVKNGPSSSGGKRNYISWLRYVGDKYGYVNESLTNAKVDDIFTWLKSTSKTRDIYTSDPSISDIKSSLNKYLKFIDNLSSKSSSICADITSIVNVDITTSQKIEIEARIGQGKYRRSLIELWKKCSLTTYSNIDFLIASHIKPWRLSDKEEKTDPFNGLLLTPNIDKLFDLGYISFANDGNIKISSLLTKEDLLNMNVSSNMKLYKLFDQNIPYLRFHQESIFIK